MRTIKGYELQERIGAGGFGAVYRAYQTTVGREVAVKIILPARANQPDFIRRFETEAQLVARLEHLHIVPLYDYWRDPDGAYLIMRWLRGGNLRGLINEGPLDLEKAALFLDQIASALACAHRSNIIHRDIKPENILLDEDGNCYLADFGIAKDIGGNGGQTGSDIVAGSPDYLSPEQARSEPVTPQTDLYSLGVVLYELLSSQHPFPDISHVERMYKHISEPLPLLKNLPTDVTDGINALIQKATAKNPAHRYADALEMAAAFREEADISLSRIGESIVAQLTPREQDVLQCLIEGKSNREIADELVITVATVKWYNQQLFKKLRVRNRVQAVIRARELNLVMAPGETAGQTVATLVALPEPENPYKGLRAFQTADARDFFGRRAITTRLLERLGETTALARFLAVIGPSGSGKSSLVKAGLIPALLRGELPGSDRWFVVEMLPGAQPIDELEVALTRIAADQTINLHEQLTRDERGVVRVAQLMLPNDDSELVIVIDQFEELFTLVEDEATRTHFLDLLHTAVTAPRSRVRVVITLRADFYDRPLHYPAFGQLVRERMETILPLSAEELEQAIVKPAERVGVRFEDGLVPTIIDEVLYQPGALPLLQYALTELFERRQERCLTHDAYREIGGTVGALAKRASELYNEYDEAGREAIRQMFLRLVTLGEGTEDTRRRVPRAELMAIAPDEDLMEDIINAFAAYRLLALDHDPASRAPTVEVAHEAILREWERLREWLNAGREDVKMQRQLQMAAAEWEASGRDPSYLLHGTRLSQLEAWIEGTELALTAAERGFLTASLDQREQRAAQERERQEREASLQRRAQRVLQALVVVFLIATVLSSGLALVAVDREGEAQDAHATSEANLRRAEREAAVNRSLVLASQAEKAFETQSTDLALLVALQAVKLDDPPQEAIATLRRIALAPGSRDMLALDVSAVSASAFNPQNPRHLLMGACENMAGDTCSQGTLILWDVGAEAGTGTEIRRFGAAHHSTVTAVAFHPTGETCLAGSEDGALIEWNPTTGQVVRRLEGHVGSVSAVAVGPDGEVALSGGCRTAHDDAGCSEGELVLWDLTSASIIHSFAELGDAINEIAFSADGTLALSGSGDGTIRLWDVDRHSPAFGQEIRRFVGHTAGVSGLAFIPASVTEVPTVLSSGLDWTLRLWNLETGAELAQHEELAAIAYLAVTPDGHTALYGATTSVDFWDLQAWEETHSGLFTSTTLALNSLSVSPDGRWVFSAAGDAFQIANLASTGELQRYPTHTFGAYFDLSPDGTRLMMNHDRDVVVLDVPTGEELQRFTAAEAGSTVMMVGFSPTEPIGLVTTWDIVNGYGDAQGESSFALWDLQTSQVLHRLEDHSAYPRAFAFSPDGRQVLIGSMQFSEELPRPWTGDLILWDVQTGAMIHRLDTTAAITGIAFNSDGTRALTTTIIPSQLFEWDMETGEAITTYTYHDGLFDVVYGPDEATALTANGDGNLVLWDLATGRVIRHFIGDSSLGAVALSPDQRYVVSGDWNGVIRLWDFETGVPIASFEGHSGLGIFARGLEFSPDGRTVFSAAVDGTVRQWDVGVASLEELLAWIDANRYWRDFTCLERELYRIEPLCTE